VRAGKFRADLYYRLNGLTLPVPPLRERTEDIEPLAEATLRRLCLQWNMKPRRLASAFLQQLARHAWPGNVRELQHVIGQALLLEESRTLVGHHFTPVAAPLPAARGEPDAASAAPAESIAARGPARRERALAALRAAGGNKSVAARTLGVTRKSLYAWLASA